MCAGWWRESGGRLECGTVSALLCLRHAPLRFPPQLRKGSSGVSSFVFMLSRPCLRALGFSELESAATTSLVKRRPSRRWGSSVGDAGRPRALPVRLRRRSACARGRQPRAQHRVWWWCGRPPGTSRARRFRTRLATRAGEATRIRRATAARDLSIHEQRARFAAEARASARAVWPAPGSSWLLGDEASAPTSSPSYGFGPQELPPIQVDDRGCTRPAVPETFEFKRTSGRYRRSFDGSRLLGNYR